MQESQGTPIVEYEGIFFEGESAESILSNERIHLAKTKIPLHCTFKYNPQENEIFDEIVGEEITVEIIGYGCDGKNSGFEIRIPQEFMRYYLNCNEQSGEIPTTPHITVSIASGAKAVDTRNLTFISLEKPIEITGKFGYYIITEEEKKKKVSYEKFKPQKQRKI